MDAAFNIEQAIRDYLPGVYHMSLGTCVDNKPWVCEVHFVYDDDLNLYFASDVTRRHSLEIAANPLVSGNIHETHALDTKPRGLYFEGTAEQLTTASEDDEFVKLFIERLNFPPERLPAAQAPGGPKFYKITVSDWYVFDARESKPAQKYHWER